MTTIELNLFSHKPNIKQRNIMKRNEMATIELNLFSHKPNIKQRNIMKRNDYY